MGGVDADTATFAVFSPQVAAEQTATGFDPKIMRQIVRLRKMESDDRQEQEALLEIYKSALGMAPPVTPEPVDI
ncbi:MAG: DUF2312 domain-containing protein [Rickettsiales bacterium]